MTDHVQILRETSLRGLVPARAGATNAIDAYPGLIEEIRTRCGPDVATLFAEPVAPTRADPANPTLTWYTSLDGHVIELANIDDVARAPIVSVLKNRLQKLKPLLQAADVGPVVASWLYIPSSRDILAVGGNPVLINWGFLPAEVAASATRREAHFNETIGRYAPDLFVPPFTPEEHSAYAARMQRRAQAVGVERSTVQTTAPGKGPPATAPRGTGAKSADAMAASMSSAQQRGSGVRAPLVATLIAVAVLCFLLWPGVLVFPDTARKQAAIDREVELLRDGNRTLEDRLSRLREAAKERVCRAPDGKLEPLKIPDSQEQPGPANIDPLPPPLEKIQVQPPSGAAAQPVELTKFLDESVVLVFGLGTKPGFRGIGSGFFISDRLIVTNRHVIEELRPETIRVTNRMLGQALSAHVVARSASVPSEDSIGSVQDFALLEIEPKPGHQFLKIATSPPKGSDVISVGYPGFITTDDPGFDRLMRGDASAAPDNNMERGYVTSKPAGLPVKLLVHSARIAQGNSGGPLVDLCSRVVGVNTFIKSATGLPITTNYAQDADELRTFLTANGVIGQTDDTGCAPQVAAATTPPPAGAPGGAASRPPPGASTSGTPPSAAPSARPSSR